MGRTRLPLVHMTREERQVLRDVIDLHIDGQEAAKEEITVDPNVKYMDTLLEYQGAINDELVLLRRVRERL
jgi:hypothetical protein